MNLPLPNPAGSSNPEPGPQYGLDQNQGSLIIDGHNHTPGSGVQITPAGLNINTNLTFQNNQATNIYGVLFSSPASSSHLAFLYTNSNSGGGVTDLFYNDGAGNVIAITTAGAVNATIASIPGESYSGGTFTWVQGAGSTTPANFDIGSITIRPNTAGTTNGVVLGPPSGISSKYNVQLPAVPGVNTGIMQIDTSGNMISTLVPDNATIVISSQILEVGTIQTANIAAGAVTTATIAANAVTRPKLVAVGQQVSAGNANQLTSGTSFTDINGMSITITTTGRPVMLIVQPNGTTTAASVEIQSSGANATFQILRGASLVGTFFNNNAGTETLPAIMMLDTPAAGTYTYKLQGKTSNGSVAIGLNACVLMAYEL